MADEKTYEMLWDCKYCGAQKLLGLTHRCCPNCGAPQDQSARYFPPDNERVAVEDHVYAGADVLCPACQEANSARAKHCRHCGAPLEAAAAVRTRAEQVHAEGFGGDSAAAAREELVQGRAPQPLAVAAAPAKKSGVPVLGIVLGGGCLTVIVGFVVLFVVALYWTREASIEVTRHHWTRTIEVERHGLDREQGWCDRMPAGAREISRERAQRSTEKVAIGEDCKTRKKDMGDGTFKEKKECTPTYEEKPVLDDRCTYEVRRWKRERTLSAEGKSLADAPRWPDPVLQRPGTCDGCERAGARVERYEVFFREPGGSGELSCALNEPAWRALAVGSRHKAAVGKLTGSLDCDTLQAAR